MLEAPTASFATAIIPRPEAANRRHGVGGVADGRARRASTILQGVRQPTVGASGSDWWCAARARDRRGVMAWAGAIFSSRNLFLRCRPPSRVWGPPLANEIRRKASSRHGRAITEDCSAVENGPWSHLGSGFGVRAELTARPSARRALSLRKAAPDALLNARPSAPPPRSARIFLRLSFDRRGVCTANGPWPAS